jgi:hypothetical protein
MGKDRGIGGWQQAYGKLHLSLNPMMKNWILLVFFCGSVGFLKAQEKRVFHLSQFVFEDTAGKKFNLDSLQGRNAIQPTLAETFAYHANGQQYCFHHHQFQAKQPRVVGHDEKAAHAQCHSFVFSSCYL